MWCSLQNGWKQKVSKTLFYRKLRNDLYRYWWRTTWHSRWWGLTSCLSGGPPCPPILRPQERSARRWSTSWTLKHATPEMKSKQTDIRAVLLKKCANPRWPTNVFITEQKCTLIRQILKISQMAHLKVCSEKKIKQEKNRRDGRDGQKRQWSEWSDPSDPRPRPRPGHESTKCEIPMALGGNYVERFSFCVFLRQFSMWSWWPVKNFGEESDGICSIVETTPPSKPGRA